MKDSEILTVARDLIADEEHWCRNVRHRKNHVDQYCAVGAMEEAVRQHCQNTTTNDEDGWERFIPLSDSLRRFLDGIVREQHPSRMSSFDIMSLNDTLNGWGGHHAVIEIFEKAIAAKQEVGQ